MALTGLFVVALLVMPVAYFFFKLRINRKKIIELQRAGLVHDHYMLQTWH
jgi:hypothetical protein